MPSAPTAKTTSKAARTNAPNASGSRPKILSSRIPAPSWRNASWPVAAIALGALMAGTATTRAEDRWNPFADSGSGQSRPYRPAPPSPGPQYTRPEPTYEPPPTSGGSGFTGAGSAKVERGELAPIPTTQDNSVGGPNGPSAEAGPLGTAASPSLPAGVWQGLDETSAEQLIAALKVPNRSPTVDSLWRQTLAAPADVKDAVRLAAVRGEALYRSGHLDAAAAALGAIPNADTPLLLTLKARVAIARRDTTAGCHDAKAAAQSVKKLPKQFRGEIIAIAGYCAIVAGSKNAGGLAAGLAQRQGYTNRFALTLLEAIGAGRKPKLTQPDEVDPLDVLLLEAAHVPLAPELIRRGSAPMLALLARDGTADTTARVAAAEEAASRNVIEPKDLAAAYNAHRFTAVEMGDPLGNRVSPAIRRALLFQVATRDRMPFQRTRLIRALIDDARRQALTLPVLTIVKPLVDELDRKPDIGWFAETAIEVSLAAGDPEAANAWTVFAAALDNNTSATLEHWRTLIDIAYDAGQGQTRRDLASVEALTLRGRFTPEMLHRLATVLDALDYNVPIPLWEAASKTPQPKTGHLPPTGVLSQLQEASKRREIARTVFLLMRSLGPDGAPGAHMIALGDSIRGLKRAGLEPEARRLAFEALFENWPRTQGP